MANQFWNELNDQQAQNVCGGNGEFTLPPGLAKKVGCVDLEDLPPGFFQGKKLGWVSGSLCDDDCVGDQVCEPPA